MVMSFSIRTETLPTDEDQELKNLVAAANFFDLPQKIESSQLASDQFEYTITIETEEQQHSVEVGETALPENLRPLLNKLRVLSRSTRNP